MSEINSPADLAANYFGRTCIVCEKAIPDIEGWTGNDEIIPPEAMAYHPYEGSSDWECIPCTDSRFTCMWCDERFPNDEKLAVAQEPPYQTLEFCSEDCRDEMDQYNADAEAGAG